jgi:hypothetical protein
MGGSVGVICFFLFLECGVCLLGLFFGVVVCVFVFPFRDEGFMMCVYLCITIK